MSKTSNTIQQSKPWLRAVITAAIGVTLAFFSAKYAIVSIAAPTIQDAADKASCRTLYKGAAIEDVKAIDPYCGDLIARA